MPETRDWPELGEQIEVRKRHGGGWRATVSSRWRMKVFASGVLTEQVSAVLRADDLHPFTRRLQQDEQGTWFAWEDADA